MDSKRLFSPCEHPSLVITCSDVFLWALSFEVFQNYALNTQEKSANVMPQSQTNSHKQSISLK